MSHIEPELTTENAKTIDEHYVDETPDEHAARMKRYDLAFERCQRAYEEYMETLDTQVNRYRREVLSHTELKDRAEDEGLLGQFANLFQQTAT